MTGTEWQFFLQEEKLLCMHKSAKHSFIPLSLLNIHGGVYIKSKWQQPLVVIVLQKAE